MIGLIIKSYFTILLSIGIASLFIFLVGLYFIFSVFRPKKTKEIITSPIECISAAKLPSHPITISSSDIKAIAGEDVFATQLDLARAYIETGRLRLAKKILNYVALQGNISQQQEALHLLEYIGFSAVNQN